MPRNSRLLALAASFLLLVAAAGRASAQASPPRLLIEKTTSQVLTILDDKGLSLDQKRAKLEQIAYDHMDFETMSKLVLARGWRDLSDAQQSEFVQEFKRQLAITYGRRLDHYGNEKVQVTGERTEPRGDVTITSKVLGGQYDNTSIDYRLRQAGSDWKIIDVVVEGVSLVASYRSQFQELLSQGGGTKVLAVLREKNAAGDVVEVPEAPKAPGTTAH